MAVRNALLMPQFAVPDVGNFINPLMQGIERGDRQRQQAFANERALASEGMNRERLTLAQNQDKRAADQIEQQKQQARFKQFGMLNRDIVYDPDPASRAAKMEKMKRIPGFVEDAQKHGIDISDPLGAARMFATMAGVMDDPLDRQIKQSQLASQGLQRQVSEAQLQQMKLATPEKRAEMAAQYGLQPGMPGYQSFVLLGTLPAPKTEETTLDKEVAKTRVDMAERDIKAAVGAQDMSGLLTELDEIGKDKNLDSAIGPLQGSPITQTIGQVLPFARQAGVINPELNARILRLQKQLELSGGEKMKGLGAQSDADAVRLQEAVSNLTSARTSKEFNNALTIIRQSIAGGLARGQAAARQFPALGAGRINMNAQPAQQRTDDAPVPGARKAPDGKWYVEDPNRPGKYLMVQP